MKINVDSILPNPQQPRAWFDETALKELADSIRQNGLIQAVTVEDNLDGTYILVDGERRLRAHKLIGLTEIDAIVRPLTNHKGKERLVSAVAANLARNALNSVEEARAYKKMREEMGMSVAAIAVACGTTNTNIYCKMKINKFTAEEQEFMAVGSLPTQVEALDALLSITDEKSRVEMSRRLAQRSPTIAIVKRACSQFLQINLDISKAKKEKRTGTPATQQVEEMLPEWDALYQVGRVPKWKNFTESVVATCDKCSLRSVASESTCQACPLVEMVTTIMESVK